MGQEYVKYVTVLGAYNTAPQDGIIDEFDTVAGFASQGIGTVTITRSTTDVFTGSGAMNVAITATGSHSPGIKRILPFPTQRYKILEFAIGQRAGNVFTKRLYVDGIYYSTQKSGRYRFGFQNWNNDVVNIQIFNESTLSWVTLEANVPVPNEGKTFFTIRAIIDTVDRKWVSIEVAGQKYDVSSYTLGIVTEATDPDGVQCERLLITAENLVNLNTINFVMDKFKNIGTTYPQ